MTPVTTAGTAIGTTTGAKLEQVSIAARADIPSRGRLLRPYVAVWALIGLVAALYLAALVLRPELVSEHLPVFRPGEPEGNQGQRAMSKALAEVQSLRQGMSQVQLDVAKLRTEVAGDQQRTATLASRIDQIEQRVVSAATGSAPAPAPVAALPQPLAQSSALTPPTPKLATAQAASPATDRSPSKDAQRAAPAHQEGQPEARLDDRPAAAAENRIETGSVAAPATTVAPKLLNAPAAAATAPAPQSGATAAATARVVAPQRAPDQDADMESLVTFGPPVVREAPGPVGLRISNGPSLDALRLSWSLLSDRHAAQLRSLEARYLIRQPEGGRDASFDLVAGPVKSEAEARKLCKALAAKKIACQISAFTGNQL